MNHSLDIRVTVSQPNEHTAMPDEVFATESLSLKAKRKSVSFGDSELAVSPHDDTYTPSTSTHAPSTPLKPALIHHAPEEALPNEVSPPRSKRKKKKSGTSSVEMNDHASAPGGEHGSRLLPEITGNRKRKDYLSTSALGKQPIISSETPAISITTNKRKKKDLGSKAPVSSTPTSYVSSKQLQPKGLERDKGRPDSEADHSSTPSSVLSEVRLALSFRLIFGYIEKLYCRIPGPSSRRTRNPTLPPNK